MNTRQCVTVTDPVRGKGFRQVSREILFYTGPGDRQDHRRVAEPLERRVVQGAPHRQRSGQLPRTDLPAQGGRQAVRDGPAGDGQTTGGARPPCRSSTATRSAGTSRTTSAAPTTPTEMFNFFGRMSDLADPKTHSADVNVAWARISDWLPWMKMRGRAGNLYFNGAGRSSTLRGIARRHARRDRGPWPDLQGAAAGRRPAPERDQLDLLQEAHGGGSEAVTGQGGRRPLASAPLGSVFCAASMI